MDMNHVMFSKASQKNKIMYAITYKGSLKNKTCEYNKEIYRKQASVYQRGEGKGREDKIGVED